MAYRIRASTILTAFAVLGLVTAVAADKLPHLLFADEITWFAYLGVFPLFTFAAVVVTLGTLVVDRSRWRFVELGVALVLLLLLSQAELP